MIRFLAKLTVALSPPSHRVSRNCLRQRMATLATVVSAILCSQMLCTPSVKAASSDRPNIVLVMADDMGWGQTSYYNHPILKTPNLDAMSASGLRFDRFYAGAPVCSPTRATVLTGRTNDRSGVQSHGYALRRQEKTLPHALRGAGYVTGHFGKWHLNGLRGPGAPVLASDDHHPGEFGFDHWLSVTNFFDRDPILSRNGKFESFTGDSSEVVVGEAMKFIRRQSKSDQPFFTVIWFGSPHSPFVASDSDKQDFADQKLDHQNHYGELVAMDRSIGTLRRELRDMKIADNTLVWFCSDNGGLKQFGPETVGGLRGHKGTIYEGGLRVPAIIEWPGRINQPRVTNYPACTTDIFATLSEIVGLDDSTRMQPQDGTSLVRLFDEELSQRVSPLGFRYQTNAALIDNNWKILTEKLGSNKFSLYNLAEDPHETEDLSTKDVQQFESMKRRLLAWNKSVEASVAGLDYPEKSVNANEPPPRLWTEVESYAPYLDDWKDRPEFKSWIQKR